MSDEPEYVGLLRRQYERALRDIERHEQALRNIERLTRENVVLKEAAVDVGPTLRKVSKERDEARALLQELVDWSDCAEDFDPVYNVAREAKKLLAGK